MHFINHVEHVLHMLGVVLRIVDLAVTTTELILVHDLDGACSVEELRLVR